MEISRQHCMALMNYLNKAAGVVPVTIAESNILQPVFVAINGVASGEFVVVFEPVEPVEPVEPPKEGL